MTHAASQRGQRIAHFGRAAQAIDHFNHLHQRHRVEEVIAGHAARVLASSGDGGNGQGRRVRRQDAVFRHHAFQRREQVALHVQPFNDGFHHQLAGRHVGQRGGGLHTLQGGLRIGGGQLALLRQLVPGLTQGLARGGNRIGAGVVQAHAQAGLRRNLRNAAPHGPGAHDADGLNLRHQLSPACIGMDGARRGMARGKRGGTRPPRRDQGWLWASAWMSSADKPSFSASTCAVCSPSMGGGRRYSTGLSENFSGLAAIGTLPAAGCGSSRFIWRASTCGSS
ncbi:hypothetical protein D3C73_1113250 [compost metagenome]